MQSCRGTSRTTAMAAPVRVAPPPHCLTRTAVRHARTHARTHGHTDTRTHNTRAHTHPPGRTHARQERAPGRHPRIGRRARARTSPAARVHTRSGGQCGGRCEAHAAPRAPARSRAPPRRSARGLLRRRRPRCAPGRRGAVPSPASTTCTGGEGNLSKRRALDTDEAENCFQLET